MKEKRRKRVKKQSRVIRGLSMNEVTALRREHGLNELPDIKPNPVLLFLRKLVSPIVLLMLATLVVSAVLKDYVTTTCVAILIVINAVLGTVQQLRAWTAMRELRASMTMTARVVRDGSVQQVSSVDLVPGDVIRIRLGDSIPADVSLLDGVGVQCDDSAITGESRERSVQPSEELLCGSVVVRGEGLCKVLRTGANSKTASRLELIKRSRPNDHAMRVLLTFIVALIVFVSLLVVALIVSASLRNEPIAPLVPLFVLLFVIGFPIALPTMLLVASTVGSSMAGKQGILVKRLNALIDAASMDVLCCDKTGTLTENRLAVARIVTVADVLRTDDLIVGCDDVETMMFGVNEKQSDDAVVLAAASLCCNTENLDPIDTAIIDRFAGNDAQKTLTKTCRILSFEPFSKDTHRTAAVVQNRVSKETFHVSKGSVESILTLCGIGGEARVAVDKFVDSLISELGCRVLAIAACISDTSGASSSNFSLLGLIALDDAVRVESASIVATLQSNGVRIIMITGDRRSVAESVMKAVGLSGSVVSLSATERAFADEQSRLKFWITAAATNSELVCVAGVLPEDKHAIVVALQQQGHIVGMTGDGANDAAALKQAEVGIAVQSAVDLAKLSASAILLRGGLAPLVPLVKIGRAIHQRLQTFMLLKASKMFQTVLFVTILFIAEGIVAIDASHVAIMMFLMDITVTTIATDQQAARAQPARRNMRFVLLVSVALGVASCLEMIAFFYFLLDVLGYRSISLAGERLSLMFFTNFVFGIASLFSLRVRSWFFSSRPSRPLMIVPLAETLLLIVIVLVGIPGAISRIPVEHVAIAFAFCVVFGLLLNDALKVVLVRCVGVRGVDY